MFHRKSDYEKLFERIDKADAYVAQVKSSGFVEPILLESFAKNLRTNTYAYKGLAARTMVEVLKRNDPRTLRQWELMWDEMQTGKLHPRELKAFHDRLVAKH